MTQTQARYDDLAEWYQQWSRGMPPLIAAQAGLLPAAAGNRVLDVGCGQGRMSRHLAGLGAEVTGVDVSAAMLGRARAVGPADITYLHADITGDLAWWDRRPFDGCSCEMALMDIDDLAGALSAVAAVRRTASSLPTSTRCLTQGWKPSASPSRQLRYRRTCYGGARRQ